MSRFAEILQRLTGQKITRSTMSTSFEAGDDIEELQDLAGRSRFTFKKRPKFIKPPPHKIKIITTNTIDSEGKHIDEKK